MTNDLVRRVITLLSAVAPDGGDAVVDALRRELTRLAPCDHGELLLALATDVHHRPLAPQAVPLVADDVLALLGQQRGFVRVDDTRHDGGCARTCQQLARRQLRSLLAVRIAFGGATRGALVLAARQPCGYASAPLRVLQPLASAAGLALVHSLKLSGLHDELSHLRDDLRRLDATLADAEQALVQARCESEARDAQYEAMQRAFEELRRGQGALAHARVQGPATDTQDVPHPRCGSGQAAAAGSAAAPATETLRPVLGTSSSAEPARGMNGAAGRRRRR